MNGIWCRAASAVACVGVCLCLTQRAAADIVRIGDSAGGVSADGSVVVGSFNDPASEQLRAYRWTAGPGGGTLQNLGVVAGAPGSFAGEVSADGNVIVGQSGESAFRWAAAGGMVSLGALPGGNGNSIAWNVSGDGAVVVGQSNTAGGFRGFRWTATTGLAALGDLPGGFDYSDARSVSADGSIIVGSSDGAAGGRAVRWTGANPTPSPLGLLRPTYNFSEALDISADGRVIVGVSGNGVENEAFRWTEAGGFQGIGDLPGGLLDSVAGGVSADGSVIVGTGNPGFDLPDEPFYWSESAGMRRLWDVALAAGADMSAWQSLIIATDVSADGTVVVGSGITSTGEFAGYRLTVPEPRSLAALALLAAAARRRRRA